MCVAPRHETLRTSAGFGVLKTPSGELHYRGFSLRCQPDAAVVTREVVAE